MLDKPTFERRGVQLTVEPTSGDGGSIKGSTRVRLLNAEDIQPSNNTAVADKEVPAFLRKMMD